MGIRLQMNASGLRTAMQRCAACVVLVLLGGCCMFGSRTVQRAQWVSTTTGQQSPKSTVQACLVSAGQTYEQSYKSDVISGCMKKMKAKHKTAAAALQACTDDDPGYASYRQLYIGRLASLCMDKQGYEHRLVDVSVCKI